MLYAIAPRENWRGCEPWEAAGAVIVHHSKLNERVSEIAGRNPLAYKSVREALRRHGRVYVGARTGRGGFIVALMPAK